MTKRLAALLLLVSTAACDRLTQVDFTRSASVTVQGVPGAGIVTDTNLPVAGAVSFGGEQALSDQGIKPSAIDSAYLTRLHVEVSSGASLERWLDDVAIHATGTDLQDVVVAEAHHIRALPAGTTSLDLDVTPGVDLKPYLTATSATLSVDATGIPPDADTTLDLTATVRVDVNVAGLF